MSISSRSTALWLFLALFAARLPAVWWDVGPLLFELAVTPAAGGASLPSLQPGAPELAAELWLELTPLEHEQPATVLVMPAVAERAVTLPGLRGATLVCGGGEPYAITCRTIYLEPVETDLAPAFELEYGVAVTGRYLLDDLPVEGVQVAVVPADLQTLRPFLVPLGPERGALVGRGRALTADRLIREVRSDDEGRFTLPPLASGEYFLEAILPSGRVHHGDPFTLPSPAVVRADLGLGADTAPPPWNLGDLDLADGLSVSFLVVDAAGQAVAGATVSGRQGTTPRNAVLYQGECDEEGRASLSGFDVERPVVLGCRAPGYRTIELEYELLPAVVECVLEPLTRLTGAVLGFDGQPPPGAAVTLLRSPPAEASTAVPLAGDGTGDPPATVSPFAGELVANAFPDRRGRFGLVELEPGAYRLVAAAPGHEPEIVDLVLAAGERLELDPVYLRPGVTIEGRVIDAETEEPLAGVQVLALEPPGAAFALTNEFGRFAVAGSRVLPLVLEARLGHYLPARLELDPETLGDAPLVLALERGGYLLAVVWDAARGAPCQGCRLVLYPGGDARTTDAAGEVFYGPLEPGRYRVDRPEITHRGSTVIERPRAETRNVRVPRGGGTAVFFGDRERRFEVRFAPAPADGWMLSARSGRRAQTVYPDFDGGYTVAQEPGERLSLYLRRWDGELGAEVEVLQGRVDAVDDAETDGRVVLPLARGSIEARVHSGGAPITAARVRLRDVHTAAVYARARTGPLGQLRLPHVPAGVYGLEVGDRTLRMVRVGDGEAVDLGDFDLVAGGF